MKLIAIMLIDEPSLDRKNGSVYPACEYKTRNTYTNAAQTGGVSVYNLQTGVNTYTTPAFFRYQYSKLSESNPCPVLL